MPIVPTYPGVYVQKVSAGPRVIAGPTATAVTAFVGRAATGPAEAPTAVASFAEFERVHGGLRRDLPLGYAVRDFFANGGSRAIIVQLVEPGSGHDEGAAAPLSAATYLGDPAAKTGLYLLDRAEPFDLLVIPPDRRLTVEGGAGQDLPAEVRAAAVGYCAARKAVYLVDPPGAWAAAATRGDLDAIEPALLGIAGVTGAEPGDARNAAVYFPRLVAADPLDGGREALFAPAGAVAGIVAATDAAQGVWHSPAGIEALLASDARAELTLTDAHHAALDHRAVNCLRVLPGVGTAVWGARTLRGADGVADDFRYLPVRRLLLLIERSIVAGTRWAVIESNDEALWSRLRLEIETFLMDLARQGAIYDYAVACDAGTTTAADVARGVVNIVVRVAPVTPGEYVTLSVQQIAATG